MSDRCEGFNASLPVFLMSEPHSENDANVALGNTRSQLDNLIEAGDWAAVGDTAALLAAASDSASIDSKSHAQGRSERSRDTTRSGVDSARAAELDQLIDAGDWEGVVLAAAFWRSEDEVWMYAPYLRQL